MGCILLFSYKLNDRISLAVYSIGRGGCMRHGAQYH